MGYHTGKALAAELTYQIYHVQGAVSEVYYEGKAFADGLGDQIYHAAGRLYMVVLKVKLLQMVQVIKYTMLQDAYLVIRKRPNYLQLRFNPAEYILRQDAISGCSEGQAVAVGLNH